MIEIREYRYGDANGCNINQVFHPGMTVEKMEELLATCYKKFTCIIDKKVVWYTGIDEDLFIFINFNGVPSMTAVKLLLKNFKTKFLTNYEYSNCWTSSVYDDKLNRWHKFLGMEVAEQDNETIIYKFKRRF